MISPGLSAVAALQRWLKDIGCLFDEKEMADRAVKLPLREALQPEEYERIIYNQDDYVAARLGMALEELMELSEGFLKSGQTLGFFLAELERILNKYTFPAAAEIRACRPYVAIDAFKQHVPFRVDQSGLGHLGVTLHELRTLSRRLRIQKRDNSFPLWLVSCGISALEVLGGLHKEQFILNGLEETPPVKLATEWITTYGTQQQVTDELVGSCENFFQSFFRDLRAHSASADKSWLLLDLVNNVKVLAPRLETSKLNISRMASTLLPVPYPFTVPGGRFREAYYWDSYWIIRGLCCCGQTSEAWCIVLNLLYCVESFGYVPNGFRTYYLGRSQPPLLSEMVRVIYETTQNKAHLLVALPSLIKEYFNCWMSTSSGRMLEFTKTGVLKKRPVMSWFDYVSAEVSDVPDAFDAFETSKAPSKSTLVHGLSHADVDDTAEPPVPPAVMTGERYFFIEENTPPSAPLLESTQDARLAQRFAEFADCDHEWCLDPDSSTAGAEKDGFLLNRYFVVTSAPRPESQLVDEELLTEYANSGGAAETAGQLMRSVRAACESGWDFSARWMRPCIEGKPVKGLPLSRTLLDTVNVLPVDLNAYLYKMEKNIAEFSDILRETVFSEEADTKRLDDQFSGDLNSTKSLLEMTSKFFRTAATKRRRAMYRLFWNRQKKVWGDLDLRSGKQSEVESAATVVPWWTGMGGDLLDDEEFLQQLRRERVASRELSEEEGTEILSPRQLLYGSDQLVVIPPALNGDFGLATTSLETGEQWDSPNCWPPLVEMAIEACERLEGRIWSFPLTDAPGKVLGDSSVSRGCDMASRYMSNVAAALEAVVAAGGTCKVQTVTGLPQPGKGIRQLNRRCSEFPPPLPRSLGLDSSSLRMLRRRRGKADATSLLPSAEGTAQLPPQFGRQTRASSLATTEELEAILEKGDPGRTFVGASQNTGVFFEKYSCNVCGVQGEGGEYTNQVGFGWSAGVVLELLCRFGGALQDRRIKVSHLGE